MIETPRLVMEPILPELILVAFGVLGVLYEAFARRSDRTVHLTLALGGLAAAGVSAVLLWNWTGDATVMAGMVHADRFAVLGRVVLIVVAALGLIYGSHYLSRVPAVSRGEFFPLMLFATVGMTLIVAAADLILVFLALEILSLALYVLTGITGLRGSHEASMKYFLLGATSSAFFLYGVAMAYGTTESTAIVDIVNALAGRNGSQALALLATALLLVGFGFKVSLVPFHMWTPDVYQGAPTPVTAFMSAATKVAAFMALIRVLTVAFQPLTWDWTPAVAVLAGLTIVVGSVAAIAQTDIKRMLAYSSIAQAGFILTGLTAANAEGIRAALFYLIAYAAMTLGTFGVVMLVSARGEERTSLDDYRGLSTSDPLLAGLLTLFLLALAGIPPTAGFVAKAAVFGAAIDAGYWPLVLVGVLASVAAAFFYLRVIVLMYFDRPGETALTQDRAMSMRVALVVPAAVVLVLGIVPNVLVPILQDASVLRW
jgi:NADH-quinone oxidoreductase subunit N